MLGLDAKFLYSETQTAHMHTLKVAVFETGDMPAMPLYDEIVEHLERRLDRLPQFRRRVVHVPFNLGHPVWVEDPDFDIRRHVYRRTVLSPGSDRELAALVAEVAGRQLPRDRPLWEITVVDGLAGDRLAVVAKIHHALADGATSVALLLQALASGATEVTPLEWHSEPLPDRRALLKMALSAHRERLRLAPRLASRSLVGIRDAAARRRSADVRPPLPLATPRTPLNVSLGATRTFAMTTVNLEDLKTVRHAFAVTLNDVFLAMCAGALRSYFLRAGALPRRPLVASVPLSTGLDAHRRGGNHVDNLYVSIASHLADPIARLHQISAVARNAKEMRAVLGNDLLEERAEIVPPQFYSLAIRAWTRSKLANHVRPPVNLVLSNVQGPAERLHFGKTTLQALYSVGPILEGIGCNITAWSYAGKLYVSVLGTPRSLPDPWQLVDALHPSLAELVEGAMTAAPAEIPAT